VDLSDKSGFLVGHIWTCRTYLAISSDITWICRTNLAFWSDISYSKVRHFSAIVFSSLSLKRTSQHLLWRFLSRHKVLHFRTRLHRRSYGSSGSATAGVHVHTLKSPKYANSCSKTNFFKSFSWPKSVCGQDFAPYPLGSLQHSQTPHLVIGGLLPPQQPQYCSRPRSLGLKLLLPSSRLTISGCAHVWLSCTL